MLLFSDESNEWTIKVVGMLSLSIDDYIKLESKTHEIRAKYRDFLEIKWTQLPKARTDFYAEVINIFFSLKTARFHSNSYTDKNTQYHIQRRLCESVSWKLSKAGFTGNLDIFLDRVDKHSRKKVEEMKDIFDAAGTTRSTKSIHPKVNKCEEIDSEITTAMQLTDLFTGCLAYELNQGTDIKCKKTQFKTKLLKYLIKVTDGQQLSQSSPAASGFWGYNQRKFQHYNLHITKSLSIFTS